MGVSHSGNGLEGGGSSTEGMDQAALDILINQIEFARMLAEAKDIKDFHLRILTILKPLGFSDFILLRRKRKSSGIIEAPLGSMPERLIEEYRQRKFSQYDMTFDYLDAGNLEPVYLSMVTKTVESILLKTLQANKNLEILDFFREFGVNDAYLIPVRSKEEQEEPPRAMFWIIAKDMEPDEFIPRVNRCKPILQLIADLVFYIGSTQFAIEKPEQVMDEKYLRLLSIMAKNNLSLQQAADKLFISLDTANKHMAQAKKALGSKHQPHTIYLAYKRGLID